MIKLKKTLTILIAISLFAGGLTVPVGRVTARAEGTVLPVDNFTYDYSDEDMYPFYHKLNDRQKNAYEVIVDSIAKGNSSCRFATTKDNMGVTDDEFTEVLESVYFEHPELFWYGTIETDSVSYADNSPGYQKQDGTIIYIGANVIFNRYADDLDSSKAEFDEMIEDIIAPTEGMSDGEKVYYLHNKVCELVSYDYNGIEEKKLDATVFGTLKKGVAVCQGYARTLQYLYRKVGLPTHLIFGRAATGVDVQDSKMVLADWEDHAWLVSKVDGKYYNIDVTWDDVHNEMQTDNYYSYIGYNFFLINDDYSVEKIVRTSPTTYFTVKINYSWSHVRNSDFDFLPNATTEANFEKLVGLTREQAYIDNFGREQIDGVVYDSDDYEAFDMKGVFEGSQGSVTFTKDSSTYGYTATGTKAAAGNRLVETAYNGNIKSIQWDRYKYIAEAKTQVFILTGEDLFNTIKSYNRTPLIQNTYATTIGFKTSISSLRTAKFYEFQNGCYLFEITPDVFYVDTKSVTKKATVVDLAKKQNTITVEQGDKLDLSSIKVKVFYNDFTSTQVDASTLEVSGFDSNTPGYQDVTLTYKGATGMLVNTVVLHVKVVEDTSKPSYTLGDVNDDGQINSDDAIRVLMHTMFPTDETYTLNQKADFNGDSQVNSDDAIRLLMHTMFPDDPTYILIDS